MLGRQSYGAEITLEAASERGVADAAITVAPNHDADNCSSVRNLGYHSTWPRRQLINALDYVVSPRAVRVVPEEDECLGPERPDGYCLNALAASGTGFFLLKDVMSIRGRYAGGTRQIDERYGECLCNFVGSKGSRNFCMSVEEEYEDGFKAWMTFGAGTERLSSMETHIRIFHRSGGDREFVCNKNKFRKTLFDNPPCRELELATQTASGTGYYYLTRGYQLVDERHQSAKLTEVG